MRTILNKFPLPVKVAWPRLFYFLIYLPIMIVLNTLYYVLKYLLYYPINIIVIAFKFLFGRLNTEKKVIKKPTNIGRMD